MNNPSASDQLSHTARICVLIAAIFLGLCLALGGCGCSTDRPMAAAPVGGDQALAQGYTQAVKHWQAKHGKWHVLTQPKCVWMAKTQWTTDGKGNPMEMGGWNLNSKAFAMWVNQYPLAGSIQHEIEHCFDLQVFGKTSEESVR